MKIIKHHDSVYEVIDFLLEEEKVFFVQALNLINANNLWAIEDWEKPKHNINHSALLKHVAYIDNRFNLSIIDNIANRLSGLFNTKPQHIDTFWQVVRMGYQSNMGPHTDNISNGENDGSYNFTVILYWNDEYSGGELHYPTLGITIKPQQWSMLIHDSILHEVLEVTSRDWRYSSQASVRANKRLFIETENKKGDNNA